MKAVFAPDIIGEFQNLSDLRQQEENIWIFSLMENPNMYS